MQAILHASANQEEFIKDLFVSLGKVTQVAVLNLCIVPSYRVILSDIWIWKYYYYFFTDSYTGS